MGFDVSSAAANAVLYSVLVFFTLLAIAAGGYCNSLFPQKLISCCLLRSSAVNGGDNNNNNNNAKKNDADHFLSARNSANAREIALSFFASGMGAWVCLVSLLFNITVSFSPSVFRIQRSCIYIL